ncbi:MAG: 16S rRNA (adenine(1518)-N(6)/adenine(1519)-N(6))-dimethyltransferase RsmA [Desulfurococcaceae archaeon]
MENYFNQATWSETKLRSWTKEVLRKYGFKPRKKLSQNFLVDPRLITEILSYVKPCETLEIGCGIGTLSLPLLTRVKSLVCVEIDEKLCRIVSEVVSSPRFTIVQGDARKIPFIVKQVVSNLPYHITSDIIIKLARENTVERAVLTLQKEVCERITSEPGGRNYGKITVLVKLLFNVEAGGVYPPSSFYPKPSVYHQVVMLNRKMNYDENVKMMEEVTKKLFTQRKRIIDKVLSELFHVDIRELGEVGRRLMGKRVFSLHPRDFYELACTLREKGVVT